MSDRDLHPITGAANFIEASLAKLVPIAISLFANLLGLGGIADKVKGIIEKVQTMVDSAIDKLIDRVLKMFKGKGDNDGDHEDAKPGDGAPKVPEVPKSLVEPATAELDGLSPTVTMAIEQAPAGTTTIYQASDVDPKSVTKNLLATHTDARLDKDLGAADPVADPARRARPGTVAGPARRAARAPNRGLGHPARAP
jgi:hypothetical protein